MPGNEASPQLRLLYTRKCTQRHLIPLPTYTVACVDTADNRASMGGSLGTHDCASLCECSQWSGGPWLCEGCVGYVAPGCVGGALHQVAPGCVGGYVGSGGP